jgi:hypothetical protein
MQAELDRMRDHGLRRTAVDMGTAGASVSTDGAADGEAAAAADTKPSA